MMQTSDGKVPHTYKELIKIIMTFKLLNLLLLKSPQNNVASNIAVTEKSKAGYTYHIPGSLWIKVINFKDDSVVQCDIPAVKNTSLDDDNDKDGRK